MSLASLFERFTHFSQMRDQSTEFFQIHRFEQIRRHFVGVALHCVQHGVAVGGTNDSNSGQDFHLFAVLSFEFLELRLREKATVVALKESQEFLSRPQKSL